MNTNPAAPSSVRPRRVVTDRRGGRSAPPYDSFNLGGHVGDDPAAVAANRGRLARELGTSHDRLVWMDQVHGTRVAVVDGPVEGYAGQQHLHDLAGHRVRGPLVVGALPEDDLADRRGGIELVALGEEPQPQRPGPRHPSVVRLDPPATR